MKTTFKIEDMKGLTQKEADQKILSEGYNELPSSKPRNVFQIALGVVKEPMFLLLVTCGTLYLFLGSCDACFGCNVTVYALRTWV